MSDPSVCLLKEKTFSNRDKSMESSRFQLPTLAVDVDTHIDDIQSINRSNRSIVMFNPPARDGGRRVQTSNKLHQLLLESNSQ